MWCPKLRLYLGNSVNLVYSQAEHWAISFPKTTLQKKVALSITTGVVLLSILLRYFRRKKFGKRLQVSPKLTFLKLHDIATNQQNPNMRSVRRQGSILSGATTNSECRNRKKELDSSLTPQELGAMGMEALEMGISHWEDALSAYMKGNQAQSLAITNEEESQFCKDLQSLLDIAYKLQDECELLFLDQRSVLFRPEGSVEDYYRDSSPADSFVSAQDNGWQMADLREFDEFADLNVNVDQLPLYQSALRHFDAHGIPYRCLRTELVRCSSDVEYLCKLHCIRIAFQWLFQAESKKSWFSDMGRQILTELMICADRDPKEFLIAYENMLMFLRDKECWIEMELELTARGVKAMTFYDVVLDYILMDAFEDLDAPPSSVLAVVQNRWLSDGFKQSALATAVWSVLKAKRRMLKFQNGFMAHFYSISDKISPLMAWGFLGPDESLKDTCLYFKEQVMGFLNDIFSFQHSRYMSVEELAEDISKHMETRAVNTLKKLSKCDKELPG